MPLSHLLDTNIVSYFVRGDFPAVRERVTRMDLDSLAVSAVTEAELRWWIAFRPPNSRVRVGVEDFLMRVSSLSWDSRAAHDQTFGFVDRIRIEDWTIG